jgi:MYXO-CTERM domain-containing protein
MPIWGAPNPMLREGLPTPERPANVPPVTSIGVVVRDDIPEIGVVAGQAEAPHPNDPGPIGSGAGAPALADQPTTTPTAVDRGPQAATSEGGCASCSSTGDAGGAAIAIALIGLALAFSRKRR